MSNLSQKTPKSKQYKIVPSPLVPGLINESKELVAQYISTDCTPPIFVILQKKPFFEWVISIEDIQPGPRFGYNVCRTPKGVTAEVIEANRDKLSNLICKVFKDILDNPEQLLDLEDFVEADTHRLNSERAEI